MGKCDAGFTFYNKQTEFPGSIPRTAVKPRITGFQWYSAMLKVATREHRLFEKRTYFNF